MDKIKIKVPATTANIGPGFDCMGLALTLYNTFTFEKVKTGLTITGCAEKYANSENLAYKAYSLVLDYLSIKPTGLKIEIDAKIPISRGLGSSAAFIVAGAFAANQLNGKLLNDLELLYLCTKLENHPDNLASALLGSLRVSFIENNRIYTTNFNIDKSLAFYALIPNFQISTEQARKILPNSLSYKDAIFNLSHMGVLLNGLQTGDSYLISSALKDRMHENYRQRLIDEYFDLENICYKAGGIAFFISGSGSTCISITKDPEFLINIEGKLSELKNNWEIIPLKVDTTGTTEIRN